MTDRVKNKFIFVIFFCLVLLLGLSGYVEAKAGQRESFIQAKEILVAENADYSRPIWCGGGELIVYTYVANWPHISFYNVKTGQNEEIADYSILPIVCSPNGESLIYLDSDGAGWDDNSVEPGTLGLWSYEFSSKEKRQLAIVYTEEIAPFGESILSPDGRKLYLGKRPKKKVEPSENDPEIIWSDTKRTASSFLWLPDSSGVVMSHWNEELGRDVLDISTFVPEKESTTIDPHSKEIVLRRFDGDKGIYMKVYDGNASGAREIKRCVLDMEKKDASCESVLKRDRDILDFDISPDGETVLFTEKGGRCVKMIKSGGGKARCVTPPGDYLVYDLSLSPGAKRLAYTADDNLYYKPFKTTPSWPDSTGKYEDSSDMEQINKFKGSVRRDGETLYLKTKSGAYLLFRDIPGCDPLSWCDYEFVDYFKDPGFYVVFMGTHEGADHELISDEDGKEYSVYDTPRLSPDKKRIVIVSSCEAFCINRVFIWRIESGKLINELSCLPGANALYEFMEWKDNRTIYLTYPSLSNKKRSPDLSLMTTPVTLRLEETGWKIYENDSTVECGIIRPGSPISE